MAANVDSPKRRSLRLQDARADVDSGTASISSGAKGPAKARTSGNEKRLSAEKRVDPGGQKRSLGKRRSTEPPHKENETERKETRVSTTNSGNTMGPNTVKSTQPMEPNTAEDANTKGPNKVQSPGGEHRNRGPRRSHNSCSLNVVDSSRAAMDNTSFSRETRSRKSKNVDADVSAIAIRGPTEDAISSKEKKDNAHLPQPKEQGSGDSGDSSSQNKSLRARRSHDSSTTNRGAAETNPLLKRQTRSSGGQVHVEAEASIVTRSKGAISNKEKTANAHHAESSSPKKCIAEDPDGNNSHNRSCGGSSFHVQDNSTSTQTLKRKTRGSGVNLEEPAVVKQDKSVVLSKQEKENPKLSETSFQHGEASEDPGKSSSHKSIRPRRNVNSNVEDSPRETGVSTSANSSSNRETRCSKAKNCEESGALGEGLGEHFSSGQIRKNVHSSNHDDHEKQRSDRLEGRESHTKSLQKLNDHTAASDNIKDCPKGYSLPTKSCDFVSEDGRLSKEKDYMEAGASTERDHNSIASKEERIIRPSNQSEKETDISYGVRSPRKNLIPRRSHNGSGSSHETISERTPSKDNKGETELPVHSGEISQVPGESISLRKKLQKTLNLEDPADDTRQPSDLTTENNTGGAARDFKVQCCSKQLLKEVLGMCTGICKEILDSQQYLNQEQKRQHHKNLAWDFETAFQENVSLRGQSWHEAPDEDSEPDVEILEEQMDEAIVKTSMKRKRYPRKVLSQFVKALKTEREILNQYTPVVNPKRVSLDPAFECRMKELSTTAATVCQNIHETKKALPIQLEKAAGFSQVLNLQPLLAESHIRKEIFYSRVMLEDISKSIPKVLETTLPESEPKDLATPVRNLRKRRISLPQRHLYPIRSKRKISLES